MSKHPQSLLCEKQQKSLIERPLPSGLAPYVLTGEYVMMIPLMPDHRYQLHEQIFSQPLVMQYFGAGKSFTLLEYTSIHLDRIKQNLTFQFDKNTGYLSRFTWTVITKDGIAGRLNICPNEGRTELAFCISPKQQGRALARRASELVIKYIGDESRFFATANPLNKASCKTIEQIHYPDGKFVFYRDLKRQNVPSVYSTNQTRDYFLSIRENIFSFFSFYLGRITYVDPSKEFECEEPRKQARRFR